MNRIKLSYLLIISCSILLIVSCRNKNHYPEQYSGGKYDLNINNDSVAIGEYIKGIAYIKEPFFYDKDVELIIYLENDESEPLQSDLSNERDIPFDLFINLENDEYNQKWFQDYDFKKSVVFGKKFSTIGRKKLRGYFLEYYGGEYDPENDTVYNGGINKQYFEVNVFVKDTIH